METGKEILDKVKAIKGTDGVKEIVSEKNRATVTAAGIGALMGAYYGYSRKKNILITVLMGALAAVVVVRLALPKNE